MENKMTTTYDTINFAPAVTSTHNFFGKLFHSSKAIYVVDQMRNAIEDQKNAILSETGLVWSVEALHCIEQGIKVESVGSSSPEDGENGIDFFNEGWLYGFFKGLTAAELNMKKGIWFKGTKEEYLVKFLTDQLALFEANYKENPTVFNDGVRSGYSNWLEGLEFGWVSFI
jgi:hypothetical protein